MLCQMGWEGSFRRDERVWTIAYVIDEFNVSIFHPYLASVSVSWVGKRPKNESGTTVIKS